MSGQVGAGRPVLVTACGRVFAPVDWGEAERSRLETALNESDFVGVRLEPSGDVDILLHVLSLPPSGPLPRDGRRVLRLTSAQELSFLLRADRGGEQLTEQQVIPLANLAAVEAFFASLAWGGSIYGWRFFDDPELTADWPAEPSLTVRQRGAMPGDHTFYWFNECGAAEGEVTVGYCLEGTVTFRDVRVLDALGNELPVETFIADGIRHWDAVFARDERLSPEAQQVAQRDAPKWRAWAQGSHGAPGST